MNTVFAVLAVMVSIGAVYVWVEAIVTLARILEASFQRGPARKTLWLVVLLLTGLIGILVWNYWGHRREVVVAPA